MEMNIPEELLDNDLVFHFSKPYLAMEEILHKQKMRFSSFINMNDPYEYKIVSATVSVRGSMSEGTPSELLERLRDAILYKSKILSLVKTKETVVEDDSQPACTKPRLWAQYAEAQYGICLVLSLETFINEIENKYPEVTIYHGLVKYDLQEGKRSSKTELIYDKSRSHDENIQAHIYAHQDDIFFRKYKDFRDENEYRIVLVNWTDTRNRDIFIDLQGILKGVILGERFPQAYIDLTKSLVYKLGASLYKIGYGSEILIQKYQKN